MAARSRPLPSPSRDLHFQHEYPLVAPRTYSNGGFNDAPYRTEYSESTYSHGQPYDGDGAYYYDSSTRLVSAAGLSMGDAGPVKAVGKPSQKHYFDGIDQLALGVSLICCAAATVTVAVNQVAYRLRTANQLIVIGFLLSIMNLCLGRVTPTFFLLLEARFGQSKLQNFDGILLNQFLKTRVSVIWRMVLLVFLALPILLSVAYKRFIGGTSSLSIDGTEITGMPPRYGMFSVPGINSVIGHSNPLSIYFNASLPFRVASSPLNGIDVDPPLPSTYPQPYGANTLLLDDQSTAMLDMPQNTRLLALQQWLSVGDSLNISANVFGTVAVHNTLAPGDDPDFAAACQGGGMELDFQDLFIYWWVEMLTPLSSADQSHIWLGAVPTNSLESLSDKCALFAQYAKRYDMTRQNCQGTWSVTRGGVELVQGSCTSSTLPVLPQLILSENTLFLGYSWLPIMGEVLQPFVTTRNTSQWLDMSFSTFAASMLWSAITGLDGPASRGPYTEDTLWQMNDTSAISYKNVGLFYQQPETIVASRPTLLRSGWLYAVFLIQPLLMVGAMVAAALLYSTPIGKGFGLTSILAGIDRSCLDVLRGASYSGELRKDVHVSIVPVHEDSDGTVIQYRLQTAGDHVPNGRLNHRTTYS